MAQTIKFSNSRFIAKVSRNPEYREWIVRFYSADGSRLEHADYFTDDKSDAIGTAQHVIATLGSAVCK